MNSSKPNNAQLQDASNPSESGRRPSKGHTRNKSNGSGIVGASGHFHPGSFKPGHNRSASVLSKISRLSVRTLGKYFWIIRKIKWLVDFKQTYNSRMFNLKNIFLGGGTELDDISSGDEENDDYDVDEELVPSANSICDEPDCDHTPERNQCSYNIPSHSNATNKISPHIKSYRTNQSNRNNPNNKTLVKSRGSTRNFLAVCVQNYRKIPS